jgi:branched-chain amino acid transport system substrate-binding protein
MYGRYVRATKPKARIAVLYQNDDYGKELLAGLKAGLAPLGKAIVSTQGFEATATDVSSQISSLKGSGANTLMIFATPAATIQAYVSVNKLGWRPQIFVNAVSSASQLMKISAASSSAATVEGSLSIVFLKDPTNPRWKNDPAMKLYRSIMAKYGTGDPNDVFNVYAMASAWTMVDALKRAGKNLTRAGLLRAVTSLNEPSNPFVLPGITIRTTPTSRFPIAQAQMQRWHRGAWQGFGPLLSARS